MRFDDDWKQPTTTDCYDLDDEPRYDRVCGCTIICTDIVGGARLFEQLPLEEFQALLADYLVLAKEVFGEDKVFATLRDDVFIGIEAPASEAIALSQAFLARLKTSSWRCSVGISYGDVVVLSQKGVLNYQGVPLAMAKGLAKISGEGGIFLDDRTAALIGAEKPFAEAISIMLPHVGRPVRALELVQDGQTVGIKDRFQGRAHRLSQELRA